MMVNQAAIPSEESRSELDSMQIIRITRCRIQSTSDSGRNAETIRYIPSAQISRWKKNIVGNSTFNILEENQSYWIEECLFRKSIHSFQIRASEPIWEISIFMKTGTISYPSRFYVHENECDLLVSCIKNELREKGDHFSPESIQKRKGYFLQF